MSFNSESATYLLTLQQDSGLTPVAINKIVSTFPKADFLLNASLIELKQVFEPRVYFVLERLRDTWTRQQAKAEDLIERHKKFGIEVIGLTDNKYPPLLRITKDPPPVLFVKGDHSLLSQSLMVAVVGTRDPTDAGARIAGQIARNFAQHGFVIVSGLAKGIDAEAHKGTLGVGGRTVAVLANPLDRVYPKENRPLADCIVEQGGLLVSEMSLGKKTYRSAFVERDRIQSGVSLAVVAVQTDLEGGTMHTVRFAQQQGRLLLCPRPLPQESHQRQYAGIRMLIESGKAESFGNNDYAKIISMIFQDSDSLLGRQSRTFLENFKPKQSQKGPLIERKRPSATSNLEDQIVALIHANGIMDKKELNLLFSRVRKMLFPAKQRKPKRKKSQIPKLFSDL